MTSARNNQQALGRCCPLVPAGCVALKGVTSSPRKSLAQFAVRGQSVLCCGLLEKVLSAASARQDAKAGVAAGKGNAIKMGASLLRDRLAVSPGWGFPRAGTKGGASCFDVLVLRSFEIGHF